MILYNQYLHKFLMKRDWRESDQCINQMQDHWTNDEHLYRVRKYIFCLQIEQIPSTYDVVHVIYILLCLVSETIIQLYVLDNPSFLLYPDLEGVCTWPRHVIQDELGVRGREGASENGALSI